MKISPTKWTIGTVVATVASCLVILNMLDIHPWDAVGWMTPDAHAEDMIDKIDARFADYDEDIKGIKAFQGDFLREWRCSEWREDLEVLLEKQANGDDSIETSEKIRSLRTRMGAPPEGSNCTEFDT